MSIVLTDISVTELSQIPIFHVHPGLDYHLRACAVDVDNGVATAPEVDGVEATTAAARIVADLPSRHISAAAHPTDNNEKTFAFALTTPACKIVTWKYIPLSLQDVWQHAQYPPFVVRSPDLACYIRRIQMVLNIVRRGRSVVGTPLRNLGKFVYPTLPVSFG